MGVASGDSTTAVIPSGNPATTPAAEGVPSVGGVLGGVVGALVGVALLLFGVRKWRRRNKGGGESALPAETVELGGCVRP